MISSKIGLNQKLSSKFFCVQTDFLENRFEPKYFINNIFVKNFLGAK